MYFLYFFVEQLYLTQLEERAREKDKMESASQMKDALEKQMEQHREQHQRQLAELRQEIADKQTRIDEISELVLYYCSVDTRITQFCRYLEFKVIVHYFISDLILAYK